MIDETIGHFRILEKIGEGGMGVVYRATDLRLDREVALKVIHPSSSTSSDTTRRLIQEARNAAKVEHPNIAVVYELDEVDGSPFIAMELIRGQSLRERLDTGPIPCDEALAIVRDVCRGLEAAHAQGIVHRDLKPENILITEGGTVKILDFGLSRLLDDTPDNTAPSDVTKSLALTRAGQIAGTIPYMAPEQLAGATVDHRTDIFALGVVLYELMTGDKPFKGETAQAMASSILTAEPGPVSRARRIADRRMDDIIGRCLAKNPNDRFQSVAELRKALDADDHAGVGNRRGLAVGAIVVIVVAAALIVFFARDRDRGDASVTEVLTIAVAPFAPVGEGTQDQSLVVREYIEREIRSMQDDRPFRVLEGAVTDPVTSEAQARQVGEALGADAVCWGKVLRAGADAEIEARITLLHPIDEIAPRGTGGAIMPDPEGFLGMVQSIPIDSPGQLQVLRSSAREVADLVATLSGLALIRNGEYEDAAQTLDAIAEPSPDQRFYRGLAQLRAGDALDAARSFQAVIDEDESHVGARLGLLASQTYLPEGDDPMSLETFELLRSTLEAAPLEPRANALLYVRELGRQLIGAETDPEVAGFLRSHLDTMCGDEGVGELPDDLKRLIVITTSTPQWTEAVASVPYERVGTDPLSKCDALLEILEEDPMLRALVCHLGTAQGWNVTPDACQDWVPDPATVHPMIYAMQTLPLASDEELGPEHFAALDAAAQRDPDLSRRSPEWALALALADEDAAIDWLDTHPAPENLGSFHFSRGVLRFGQHAWADAESEFREAEVAGYGDELLRFRAASLVAQEEFAEALAVIGDTTVAERAFVLATQGQFVEAYRVEPETEDSSLDNPMLRDLFAMMARAIERNPRIRDAYALHLRRKLSRAYEEAGASFSLGWSFDYASTDEALTRGLETRIRFGYRPDIPFDLPQDNLELLRDIQALPDEDDPPANWPTQEEVDAFVRGLADEVDAFVRARGEEDGATDPGEEQ